MTTAGPASLPMEAAKMFRLAAESELAHLWTLRIDLGALLAAAALMLLIGAAFGVDHSDGDPVPIWYAAQLAIVPGQFAILLAVLLAVTGEYSTGALRSTLQWVPRRGVLLAARVLVPVAFATAWAVAVSTATDLLAWSFLGEAAEVVPGDVAASLGRIALVVAFGSVLAVGLGLLLCTPRDPGRDLPAPLRAAHRPVQLGGALARRHQRSLPGRASCPCWSSIRSSWRRTPSRR